LKKIALTVEFIYYAKHKKSPAITGKAFFAFLPTQVNP